MRAKYLEFLVEEPSMGHFLRPLFERVLPKDCKFSFHPFSGKQSLLKKLPSRLNGYRHWLPPDHRIVVIVDQDDDDCRELKAKLESATGSAQLRTPATTASGDHWQVVHRIAIEELEAWYFGDWEAVRSAYPSVSPSVPKKAGYRDPDAVRGGTAEAFERILKKGGYFRTGLRKNEAARAVGAHIEPARNRSGSFQKLYEAIVEAVT